MWGFLGLVVLVCLARPTQGEPKDAAPAAVAVFSPEAFARYIITFLFHHNLLQNHILTIRFPNVPSKAPPEHWITDLHIERVFLPNINVELRDTGFAVLHIKARLHFNTKFFFGKHHEMIDIIVDVETIADFRFVSYFAGLVLIKVETCKSDFKIAKVILPAHLLGHTVRPVVKSVLADMLPGSLCSVVEDLLKLVKIDFLSTVNVLLPMGKVATIEYELANLPLISAHFVTIEIIVVIRIGTRIIVTPFRSVVFPVPSLKENHLCLGMTEVTVEAFLSVLLQVPQMEFMITPQIFSGAEELTAAVSALFAHVKCPKCPVKAPLKVTVTVVGDKRLVIEPKKATLKISVEIAIFSKGTTGAFSSLFVLKANIKLTVQASVHDCLLYFKTKLLSSELVLLHSDVGPIEIMNLDKWFQMLLVEVFVPHINELLNIGVPLPSILDIPLNYPSIQWMDGMLALCA